MTPDIAPATATSALGVWRELQARAGLELRRRHGVPGRDADLEDSLVAELFPVRPTGAVAQTLDELLQAESASATSQVSVEAFVLAVLTAQRGYAAMMRSILGTLAQAQSGSASALDIEFRFDAVSDPIRLTLEQFRETTMRVESVLESRYEIPTDRDAWLPIQALRRVARPMNDELPAHDGQGNVALKPTGHAPLDRVLAELETLAGEFRDWRLRVKAASHSDTPADARDMGPDEIDKRQAMISDRWDVGLRTSLVDVWMAVRDERLSAEAAADAIKTLTAGLPTRAQWVETTVSALSDLLQLPVWRRRHELYAVWIGCVLLKTAREHASSFHFHTSSGALSFAFGGSRLATYDWHGVAFDIWAELRSELIGASRRRTRAIQPDFRVLRASLSGSMARKTHLVVECKHYLGMRADHFVDAAGDYARSCPAAKVLLVNHGPADAVRLSSLVAPDLRGRVRFIGHVTAPREEAEGELTEAIRAGLFEGDATPVHATKSPSGIPPCLATGETPEADNPPEHPGHSGVTPSLEEAMPAAVIELSWKLSEPAPELSLRVTYSPLSGAEHTSPVDAASHVQVVEALNLQPDEPGRLSLHLPKEPAGLYRIDVDTTHASGTLDCEIRTDGERRAHVWPRIRVTAQVPFAIAIADFANPWYVATVEVSHGRATLVSG